MKKKLIIKSILIAVLFIAVLFAATYAFDLFRIDIQLRGEDRVISEYGRDYVDAGAEVRKTAVIFPFIHKEIEYQIENEVNTQEIGEFEYRYVVNYKNKRYEKIRTVEIRDQEGPVIELVSDPDHYTLPNHSYQEEGFTAVDVHDGDITDKVIRTDDGDRIIYQAVDSFGNETIVIRAVIFDDRNAPEITFNDLNVVRVGNSFSNDFTAIDDGDGDVTDKVVVEGTVDVNKAGEYLLKYSVTDSYGNKAEAERTIKVVAYNPNKVIYMTFDDGPYKYTEDLLDLLARYNIKATFFVTGAYPGYHYCIKRAYNEGHAIGVHTWTHNYAVVYSSPEAYWDDFNKMNAAIEQQIGHRVNIFRFPGGSSNTVSMNYCDGVVSAVARQAAQKGYVYFDWNVESGDAGRTTDPYTVAQNLIDGVSRRNVSVCLSHDVKWYTVEGIERFFIWALDNGYTFLPLDENSPTAHHPIAN